MTPVLLPVGKSNGNVNDALPLPSVVTPGILPVASGRLAAWLVTHCESPLKYQCTVKVVFGVLLSVALTVIASIAGLIGLPGDRD